MSVVMEKLYSRKHGGPYDRGSADCYYGRPFDPHYYPLGTGFGERVTDLTPFELQEYAQGYTDQLEDGGQKDWD
jgi:hypothetical protein